MLPDESALITLTRALSLWEAVTPEGACDFCPSEVVVVEGLVVMRLQPTVHNARDAIAPKNKARIAKPPCLLVLASISIPLHGLSSPVDVPNKLIVLKHAMFYDFQVQWTTRIEVGHNEANLQDLRLG
jgi:hypothetical protein